MTDGADGADHADGADGAAAGVVKRLGRIVESEARRALEEAQVPANPARIAAGWERRFLADTARAAEAVTLYGALGYETVADPLRQEDLTGDCDDCQLVMLLQYRMIYTRRPPAAGHGRA
jgi:hypothetical protein